MPGDFSFSVRLTSADPNSIDAEAAHAYLLAAQKIAPAPWTKRLDPLLTRLEEKKPDTRKIVQDISHLQSSPTPEQVAFLMSAAKLSLQPNERTDGVSAGSFGNGPQFRRHYMGGRSKRAPLREKKNFSRHYSEDFDSRSFSVRWWQVLREDFRRTFARGCRGRGLQFNFGGIVTLAGVMQMRAQFFEYIDEHIHLLLKACEAGHQFFGIFFYLQATQAHGDGT